MWKSVDSNPRDNRMTEHNSHFNGQQQLRAARKQSYNEQAAAKQLRVIPEMYAK